MGQVIQNLSPVAAATKTTPPQLEGDQRRIMEFFERHPKRTMHFTQVRDTLGITHDRCEAAIRELLRCELLVKVSFTNYRLNPKRQAPKPILEPELEREKPRLLVVRGETHIEPSDVKPDHRTLPRAPRGELKELLLLAIEEYPGLTPAEISKKVDIPFNSVGPALSRMFNENLVAREPSAEVPRTYRYFPKKAPAQLTAAVSLPEHDVAEIERAALAMVAEAEVNFEAERLAREAERNALIRRRAAQLLAERGIPETFLPKET